MEWDSQKLFSKEMIVMNLMSNSVLIGKIIMLLVLKYWNLHALLGFPFFESTISLMVILFLHYRFDRVHQ